MAARPSCPRCGGLLASDNPGPRCSPCARAEVEASASLALRRGGERDALAGAFARGGVPAVAAQLGCPLREALDLALLHRLVPSAYRRRYQVLLRLLALGPVPHTVAAGHLGLSRWTVAAYRRALGVADSSGHGQPRRGAGGPVPPAAAGAPRRR